MNENLPPSLTRFAAELERALRRELGLDGARRARRRLRTHPRLLAGTSLGVAGAGTAIALALTAASSSPAFAVTSNRDGTYSVSLKYIGAIPAANKRLAGMSLHARLVQVHAGCAASWTSMQGATRGLTPGETRARSAALRLADRSTTTVRIDPRIPPPCWTSTVSIHKGGNSGNSGSAAPGNSGNSGNGGNSGGWTMQAVPPPGSGSSGNSGNSGSSDNSGNSGSHQVQHAQGCTLSYAGAPPPDGNSGNS